MKIVHVTQKLDDVRARKAARWARERGHDLRMVMGAARRPDVASPLFRAESPTDGFQTFRLNLMFEHEAHEIVENIHRWQPDVVHVHELDTLWLLTAKWTPVALEVCRLGGLKAEDVGVTARWDLPFPVVYEPHKWEAHRPGPWVSNSDHQDRAWRESRLFEPFSNVVSSAVVVSGAIAEAFERRYDRTPQVVYNAPPTRIRAVLRNEVRRCHGLEERDRVLVFGGNVTPDRGLEDLAIAMGYLAGWQLWIVGQRGFDPGLDQLLADAGAKFFDPLPYPWPEAQRAGLTLLDALSAADVAFNGADLRWDNLRYGAPNKVFEYAAAGTPVVTAEMEDVVGWCRYAQIGERYNGTVRELVSIVRQLGEEKREVRQPALESFTDAMGMEHQGGPAYAAAYEEARDRWASK